MADDVRISTALFTHPKYKKLRRRHDAEGCLGLIRLFSWAADNRWDGSLAGMSDEDIELAVDWPGDEGAFVLALSEVGFLDGESGNYRIHDWADHNPFAATRGERVEKARRAATKLWETRRQHAQHDSASDAPGMPDACDKHVLAMPELQTSNAHHTTPPHHINISSTPKKPEPVPGPLAWDGSMISTAVLSETGLSGQDLARNLSEVGQSELGKGKDGKQLVDELTSAVNAYRDAQAAGKLTPYAVGIKNFIGDGLWRDPKLWRWKEGYGPPKATVPRVDLLAEVKAQRAAAQKDHDANGSSE